MSNFKWYKLFFLSFLGITLGVPASAGTLISNKFNQQQQKIIQESLSLIESRAPRGFMDLLHKKNISIVEMKARSKDKEIASTNGSTIFIDPQILDVSYFSGVKAKTRHRDHRTFLAATLIHEMAHIADIQKHSSQDEAFLNAHCRWNDVQVSARTSDICSALVQKKGFYSYSSNFLAAAGRQNAMGFERLNWNEQASPDSYEFQSPREAFAVHMEFFVLDSSYACKKPAVHSALSKMFGAPSVQHKNCSEDIGLVYSTEGGVSKTIKLSQIQSVSYFFASKGESMPSRYGHAMLYLTVCPEGKDPKKVSCENHIEEHVAISPAALVYRGISFMDGLSGKYDFNYFVVPVTTAIDDYTVKELRDLEVYPLKLKTQDVGAAIVDFVWNFTGKYFFMSNNCAHGVANLINSVSNANIMTGGGFSPLELRDVLMEKGIIDRTPKKVFTADRARLQIKESVLKAIAVPWEKLVLMPQEDRKTLYEKAKAQGQVSWSALAQVEYMIFAAQKEQISVQLSIFIVEKRKVNDDELKNIVQRTLMASSNVEDRQSYGVPSLKMVQNLKFQENLQSQNADLVAEFKQKYSKLMEEYVKSNQYYIALLEEVIK